jgi:peptide/nickel transport system permease protein
MFTSLRPNAARKYFRPARWLPSRPTPLQWVAIGLLALVVLAALLPGLLVHQDPLALSQGPPRQAPSWGHVFGTDEFGRDIFARVVFAARSSVLVGIAAPMLALVAGTLLGSAAAMLGRWTGAAVQRLTDVLVAFPAIVLAVVLASVFSPGLGTTILVLAIIYTPAMARVVRANVTTQLREDYVTAARSVGASRTWLLVHHIGRNAFAPVLVFATTLIADVIFMEAALSFIGLGIQPPTPSWGNIINDGRTLTSSGGWWVTTFAGLAVFLCVLAVNIVAEWLSESLDSGRRATTDDDKDTAATVTSWPRTSIDPTLFNAREPAPQGQPLLRVRDLTIGFPGVHGDVDVVRRMRLDVRPGEVVGLVGESGSGKSLTGLAVTGLLPASARVSGSITFRDRELLTMDSAERRPLLSHEIAIVYQDALSSLNPGMTVRQQLRQVCRRGGTRTPAELLEMVDLPAKAVLPAHPHELSGGQRQRVLIALALARNPALLIADEPTTALDETIQAQVLATLELLRREFGLAILLVSHDLALIGAMAHRVVVLYAGQVAEVGDTADVLARPVHPYTNGLLASVVSLERQDAQLAQIGGTVPAPTQFESGCRFAPRCTNAEARCAVEEPPIRRSGAGHHYACWHPMVEALPDDAEVLQ